MTTQQATALGILLTNWAQGDLRSVTVALRLSPGTLDALPPGYIAGEILATNQPPMEAGTVRSTVRLAFGISPEGDVSS